MIDSGWIHGMHFFRTSITLKKCSTGRKIHSPSTLVFISDTQRLTLSGVGTRHTNDRLQRNGPECFFEVENGFSEVCLSNWTEDIINYITSCHRQINIINASSAKQQVPSMLVFQFANQYTIFLFFIYILKQSVTLWNCQLSSHYITVRHSMSSRQTLLLFYEKFQ